MKEKILFHLLTFLILGVSGIPLLMNEHTLIVVFLVFFISIVKYRKTFLKPQEVGVFLVFTLIFCLQFYFFDNFSFKTLMGTILRMLIGLLYFRIMGFKFIDQYVKTIYFICLICAIIYVFININHEFYELVKSLSIKNTGIWEGTSSVVIYHFSPISEIYRNIGPFWEPGIFGFFVNVSLFFKLFIKRNKLSQSKLEIFTIFTTVSTANYIVLAITLGIYFIYIRKSKFKLLIIIPLLVTFLTVFFTADFLNSKINSQIEAATESDVISGENRFVSMIRDYDDFKESWITGTGFYLENRFHYSPMRTNSNSGFSNHMVVLGLFGGCFYFILLFYGINKIISDYSFFVNFSDDSYPFITKKFKYQLSTFLFLILLISSIGEQIYSMSIMYGLIFFGSTGLIKKQITNNNT